MIIGNPISTIHVSTVCVIPTIRSVRGANSFCRIRGYISTAKKNQVNALDTLEKAFLGKPFFLQDYSSAEENSERSPPI